MEESLPSERIKKLLAHWGAVLVIGVDHPYYGIIRHEAERMHLEERQKRMDVLLVDQGPIFPIHSFNLEELIIPTLVKPYNPNLPEESLTPEKFYLTKHPRGKKKR